MAETIDWHQEIFDVLQEHDVSLVAHVPDTAHAKLIKICEENNNVDVVNLTTEEEGIGILSGAWTGGRKGVLLIQSSGLGNCINALALPRVCNIPFLTIITMRGEWGEMIPWQVPMGQAAPKVLEAMGVHLFRVDSEQEIRKTVDAAAKFATNNRLSAAVIISQKMIGPKQFKKG